MLLAEKKLTDFEVFNVGGDQNNFTKKQIVELINKFIPINEVTFTDKTQDPRNYEVNFSKINKQLNFKINFTVEDGIQEIIEYFKKNNEKLETCNDLKFGNYIINKKKIMRVLSVKNVVNAIKSVLGKGAHQLHEPLLKGGKKLIL